MDKVESEDLEDLLETEPSPLSRQHSDFTNRLPNGTNHFQGIRDKSRKII